MSDQVELIFGKETSEFITLVVPRDLSEKEPYLNFNPVEISASCGAFNSHPITAQLMTTELIPFFQSLVQLMETLKGEAKLDSAENWIDLKIVGDGTGQLGLFCILKDEINGNSLQFSFALDQTYLTNIVKEIQSYLNP